MLRRRQMTHEGDVRSPGKIRRILRPGDDEPQVGPATRRLEQKLREARLTVGCIGADVREVGPEALDGRDTMVLRWIGMPVERMHAPRTEFVPQHVQSASAGVTQDEIEAAETFSREIGDGLAARERGKSHGCIEIVKDACTAAPIENVVRARPRVRAEGREDRRVGLAEIATQRVADIGIFVVENEPPTGDRRAVPVLRVILHVLLVEDDFHPALRERSHEAAPEGGVPITPGRGEGEPENDEFHGSSPSRPAGSLIERTTEDQASIWIRDTDAGSMSKR